MGRRVFLDVGAHRGQSLSAVLDLDFDHIVCFEPVSSCWPVLKGIAQGKAKIEPFGLWDRDCERIIYDPGTKGAGLWVKDKRRASLEPGEKPAECIGEFRKARDWFSKYLKPDDTVFLKLNCEGAECDIIDDLLDSGEFEKVDYMMVDFDSRKIESQRHREAETRARLAPYSAPRVLFCKDVMRGNTHRDRIRHWLKVTGGVSSLNCG